FLFRLRCILWLLIITRRIICLFRQVAVRIRPLRLNENQRVLHAVDKKTVVVEDDGDKNDVLRQKRGGERQYVYDAVFGEDSTQVRSHH
ncbi:hypothetical protein C0J52_09467, partial [Blattella germanica]